MITKNPKKRTDIHRGDLYIMKQTTIFKDESAIAEPVEVVKGLVLIIVMGLVGIYIASQVVTVANLQEVDVAASGTYNFTGNSTVGEFVNITNATGSTMCYYFNTTGITKPVGCLVVDVRSGANTSSGSATALRTSIGADGDINGSITITNTSSTNMVVTWNTAGTVGNSIATIDTVTNGAWVSATLTGGLDASSVGGMQQNILSAGETGSSFVVILIIAFIGGIAISYLAIFGRKRE